MYLPTRDAPPVPGCKTTPLQIAALVLGYFGWPISFFLLAVLIWRNHHARTYASKVDELQKERDSLSQSCVRRLEQIESLHDDLETSNHLLKLARATAAKLARDRFNAVDLDSENESVCVGFGGGNDSVFVVGNDDDSDSDSDDDSISGLSIGIATPAAFSTSLRPAPVRTPTPTRLSTPARTPTPTRPATPTRTPTPAPAPSEPSGGAKTPGGATPAGETPRDDAQNKFEMIESVLPRPTSMEHSGYISPRSLFHELAMAQAGEDFGSECSSARPSMSTEVL